MNKSVLSAPGAAALFGASTPFAKLLTGDVPPVLLAGLLYLSGLGTARTGAEFSTAPFIGAAVALFVFSGMTSLAFWIAAVLMGLGVWLHLTEYHVHEHLHEVLEHAHDEHHQHAHDSESSESGNHSHHHTHLPLKHTHPHYPDVHHQHIH